MSSYSLPVKLHQKSVVIYDACIALRQFPPHCVFTDNERWDVVTHQSYSDETKQATHRQPATSNSDPSYPSRCVPARVMANAGMKQTSSLYSHWIEHSFSLSSLSDCVMLLFNSCARSMLCHAGLLVRCTWLSALEGSCHKHLRKWI